MNIYSCKTEVELEMLKDKKQIQLMESHHWSTDSLDLNPVDFGIWSLLEQNIYQGHRTTDLDSLKEAIADEWNKIPQEIIDKCTDTFKPRL